MQIYNRAMPSCKLYLGLSWHRSGKESTCQSGDLNSIPELGRSLGEGNGTPLSYSCLENNMDGGAWQVTVVWCRKSRIQPITQACMLQFKEKTISKL